MNNICIRRQDASPTSAYPHRHKTAHHLRIRLLFLFFYFFFKHKTQSPFLIISQITKDTGIQSKITRPRNIGIPASRQHISFSVNVPILNSALPIIANEIPIITTVINMSKPLSSNIHQRYQPNSSLSTAT